MFIGHAGLALAVKAKAPTAPLGALMAATYGLDLIWPIFLLTGIERVEIVPGATAFTPLVFDHYPWSHSLAMSVVWGAVAFGVAVLRGVARSVALVIGGVVISHWFLDVVMHRPDLPVWPGSSLRLGLSLWDSVPATLVVEGIVFVSGVVLYLRSSHARDTIGAVALWALLIVLVAIWASTLLAPPPPSVPAVAVAGLSLCLFAPWAAWIDRHRERAGLEALEGGA